MGDSVTWITHKGKRISYRNFAGLQEEKHLVAIDDAIKQLDDLKPGDVLLTLTDVSGTHTTVTLRDKYKELEKAMKPFLVVNAVYGLTGIMRIIAKAFTSEIYYAKTMEEAKEYLVTAKPKKQ